MPRRTIHEVSVEGSQRRKPSNHIVYSIKVAWSDGTINMVYRRYSEVLQLERNLQDIFPSNKRRRILPSLEDKSGRIKLVPTSVHTKVDQIRNFLLNLVSLPDHISKCQLVMSFFTPRPEDLESVEPAKNPGRKKSRAKSARNILRKISLGHPKTANSPSLPIPDKSSDSQKNCASRPETDLLIGDTSVIPVVQKVDNAMPKKRTFKQIESASRIGEPVLLEQYVVLEDYQKRYKNDISLKKGYSVDVIEKHESGWWHVDCEGDIGWVPASFIMPVLGDNNNESIVTEIFPAGKEEIYMTTHSYQAKKEDEISFDIGVNLQVLEKTLDGWWRVIYMNKEGWAPAVYLRRVSLKTCPSPESLKRLPAMGMQLRGETGDFEEVQEEVQEEEEQDTKRNSFLRPVCNPNRRHSASEAELSLVKTVNQESYLSSRRSSWGSVGDLRDALPNRGMSISELDLRLAQRKEEERLMTDALKRNRSFSISDNIKDIFGKKNLVKSVSLEDVPASVKVPSSPLLRLKAFSKSVDFSGGSFTCKIKRNLSGNSLNQKGLKRSPPSICIATPLSDTEHSSRLSRKLGTTPKNVEGNECHNINVNQLVQKEKVQEETQRNGERQLHGSEEKEDLKAKWNTYRRHSSSEVEVSLLKTGSQKNLLTSRRSSWSSEGVQLTTDLRHAQPNRGLSISELDLRLAHHKEEEHKAADTFSFSDKIKDVFRKTNLTNSVSTENVQVPMRKVSSLVLPSSKASSTSFNCSHSSCTARKLSLNINGNLSSQRELKFLLPTICITPPVSDSEETPFFTRKFSSAPENAGALKVNDFLVMTQTKEEKKGKEDKELQGAEKECNACGKINDVSKHQEKEESKQDWRIELDCKGESVYVEQLEQTRDSKGQKNRIDKVKTDEEFDENEYEKSDTTETDVGTYFAVSSFVASGYGEMTVFEGEEVKVVRKAPNGWWMVHIDGERGWVPSNFLIAKAGKEEEDNQESLDSDADQGSEGFSFVEDDGDVDERGHQDDYEDDDGDDEDTDENDGNFNISSGMYDPKDEGQSVEWTQPVLTATSRRDRYHEKSSKYSEIASFSSSRPLGHSNEFSFDLGGKNQHVNKRSPGTLSKSSTENNSSDSDKLHSSEKRRGRNNGKAFITDKQPYKTAAKQNRGGHYQTTSCCEKGVCRQQKRCNSFEALTVGSAPRSPQARYSVPSTGQRLPLVKKKNVMSYDSGFLEDERTNVSRKMRHSSSLSDARGHHHKKLSHMTPYRRYHSHVDEAYSSRNVPKYRVDRAPLNVIPADDSSDDEVFFQSANRFVEEDSSCDDVSVHSYTLRPRKKKTRPKLPRYSIQEGATYDPHQCQGHSTKLTHRAIAPYQASSDGTIDLYEGDKVHVIRKSRGGWWLVQIDDEVGWAPSNFLEPITCS